MGGVAVPGRWFQPTRPRRARRQCSPTAPARCTKFQPTRPRRARHDAVPGLGPGLPVSTHAPTQGATKKAAGRLLDGRVSTHAPTQGATCPRCSSRRRPGGFNPRAHAGRDYHQHQQGGEQAVSTHAPTQGATGAPQRPQAHLQPVSTHAPTQGATPRYQVSRPLLIPFQPTRPRRARRPATWCRSTTWWSFNPRAHAGRDRRPGETGGLPAEVSTHAPTQGATELVRRWSDAGGVSTHAHTQGATSSRSGCSGAWPSFNPRAHAGRDLSIELALRQMRLFQPTRPRRARHWRGARHGSPDVFQPTRPRRARLGRRRHEFIDHSVSTHAPTQGATKVEDAFCAVFACFNPRAHAGRDRGERPVPGAVERFNPRAHAGRDRPGGRHCAQSV